MSDFELKIAESISEILKAYTSEEDGPWEVASSGGKDSTVMTALVFRALLMLKPEQRNRKIYIVSSQTHLDLTTDPTKQREFQKMQKVITLFNLPVEIVEVSADIKNNLLFLWLGKGYPLSSKANQYCSSRAKIEPMEKFEKVHKPVLKLLGVRKSESLSRSNSIEKHRTSEYYGDGKTHSFMPIVHFTLDDIWTYLAVKKLPWGDAEDISKLYKDATGECGLTRKKAGSGEKVDDPCGARFGCIVCPIVSIDKSTRETAKHNPWFQPYAEIRDIMIEMYKDTRNRAGYQRNGIETFDDEGNFSIRARMELFDLFMTAQQENERIANKYKAMPQPIFWDELIEQIKKQWEIDAKESPWLIDAKEIGLFFEQRPKGVRGRKGVIPGQMTWNEKH